MLELITGIKVGSQRQPAILMPMPDIRPILRDAYSCSRCPAIFGFTPSSSGSYFKFPPLIGANDQADLLFVGINPRRSASNSNLHHQLMSSKKAFKDLAANRVNGSPYIHHDSGEPHYHDHLEIIRQVYGKPRLFESCACVTELFLCASKNSAGLPHPESPCAAHFLPMILEIIQPKVIVAVGSRVFAYFKTQPGFLEAKDEWAFLHHGQKVPVIKMPHPGNSKLAPSQRRVAIQAAALKIRAHL